MIPPNTRQIQTMYKFTFIGDDETQGQTAYINANKLAKYLLYTSHLNNKS